MKKKFLIIMSVILVLSLLSILAFADDDDDDADGIWCYTPDLSTLQTVTFDPYGGDPTKAFLAAAYSSTWTGTFSGSSTDYGLLVAHGPEPFSFVGTVSFVGEVDDESGTLEMDVMGDRPAIGADWRGTWVITGGTSELADLEGHGEWWGPGWQGDPLECGVIYYSAEDLDDDDD